MSKRLSHIEHDGAGQPVRNLFFALRPDAASAMRIAALAQELRREHSLEGTPLKTGNLHVSLFNLASYRGDQRGAIDAAVEAATTMSFPVFDIIFDLAGSFASSATRAPLVLRGSEGVSAVRAFHSVLGDALTCAGVGKPRPFEPHVTMLYDRRSIPWRSIDLLGWRVTEFVLVQSIVGEGRHIPTWRFPLGSQRRSDDARRGQVFMCAAGFLRGADTAASA
jgi:RNA 2',3'-cyclic 3'-phosphodiesterase